MDAACVLKKTRGDDNHAFFMKVRGKERLKGKRKIKLLKHVFWKIFSKIFLKNFLARYARLFAIYPPIKNASMQHDFTNLQTGEDWRQGKEGSNNIHATDGRLRKVKAKLSDSFRT